MSLWTFLFGPKPVPIDANAKFMNALHLIIREAVADGVTDDVINFLLKDEIGVYRWRPQDDFLPKPEDIEDPDIRALILSSKNIRD